MTEATEDKISSVIIPHNLFPNSATFYFYFDANKHTIFVELYSKGRSITVPSVLNLLSGLCRSSEIVEKYREVIITEVQDKTAIDRIFSLKVIKELRITIEKPNSDVLSDDFESNIEAHLAATHSRKVIFTYQAEAGSSIVPTDELKEISAVALRDGNVSASGRDYIGAVQITTDRSPKILHGKYDPDVTSEEQAFRRILPGGDNAAA